MLAFNHTYWLLAVLFVVMMPLIALMRKPTHGKGKVVAH